MKALYLGRNGNYGVRAAHIECNNKSEIEHALKIIAKTSYKAYYIDDYCIDIKVDDKYDFDCFMNEWKQAKRELKHA